MEQTKPKPAWRLEQILGLAVLFLLLLGCIVVMRPFVTALMWAVILCFSLWPVHRRVLYWVKGRQTIAALITTICVALVLIGPFVVIGFSVADDVRALGTATRKWVEGPPAAPDWLGKIPLVGNKATEYWNDFAQDAANLAKTVSESVKSESVSAPTDALTNLLTHALTNSVIHPLTNSLTDSLTNTVPKPAAAETSTSVADSKLVQFAGKLLAGLQSWLLKAGLAIGRGVTEVGLSVFLAFFMFRDGPKVAERVSAGVGKIAGDRGSHLMTVAGNTVRGVVYGILGTGLVQGVTAAVGYMIAGVPGAMLLGLLTFFLSVVPMGPPLLWIPAAAWLFSQGRPGWGVFMIIWGFGVSSIDNVVKPWLISQGSDMPFILIFFGVLGGALAFGFIGVFIGPTLLAVGYRLIEEWSTVRSAIAPKKPVD